MVLLLNILLNNMHCHFSGWRVSCSQWWNTTEGGPCYMRPTQRGNYGAPGSPGVAACSVCDGGIYCEGTKDYRANMTGLDANGNFLIRDSKDCKTASFTKNGVQLGGKARGRKKPKNGKHPSGWSNMVMCKFTLYLCFFVNKFCSTNLISLFSFPI